MYSEELERLLSAMKIQPGSRIRIKKRSTELEGVLMPRPELGDSSIIVLKLDSGYNIGIKYAPGMRIEKIGKTQAAFDFPKAHIKSNPSLSKITLVSTGGTIESRIDYVTGGVYMLVKPEELLYEVPELADIANINIVTPMSIASEDMTYLDWQIIAKEVAKAFEDGSHGVVIMHGTDTMHYSSAALSFMLQNLPGPVVFTGAQRSGDRGSSDAFMNLICASIVAARSDIAEVGICMHASSSDEYCNFIRGTKARKMHTSRRDAFRPVNDKPIASVSESGAIEYKGSYSKPKRGDIKLITGYEPKVALVKFYPNSDPGIIDYYVGKGFKGLIIEGTGLGHVAIAPRQSGYSWLNSIKNAVESGVLVGVTSQCLYGRTNASVYRNLRLLSGAGAIHCEDMLPETALVKLGFLLGNYKKEEAANMLNKNLVGEISSRTEIDAFLV
ncbi:MAG: Glu-tRNA(Gln) amidotransferase subunit GatD [Candidatus Micrarchaeaceae archaeon]